MQTGITEIEMETLNMAKVLVLYYSAYGHMEQMAKAAAEGAREAGAQVDIKRVAELVPLEVAQSSGFKLDQEAEIATPADLENYDAIIVGVSSRFGTMSSQLKNFFDQTGGLWAKGALLNKVGSVMASSATQHGGQELALISTQWQLQHHGMIIVPLSYAYQGQLGNDVVRGGAPYGMTTTADGDGSRQPSEQELDGARFQGKRVAEIAAKIHG
ncbi:NAD(P)H dehydrogenase (quinone) [Pseudochrobactrum sp. MP213Fo]